MQSNTATEMQQISPEQFLTQIAFGAMMTQALGVAAKLEIALDLEMLTSPGGAERTAEEYGALLAQAGFRLTRIVPTKSPFSIIEAVKA